MLISAAVLRAADAPYAIEQVQLNDPGPGEVLVKIAGAGLCHTDLLGRSGLVGLPVILGHEGAGVIEAIGPGVNGLAPGDHVVLTFDSCGTCTNCLAAHPAYCAEFFPRNRTGVAVDGSTPAADLDGRPVAARWFGQSSLASHAIATGRNVVQVDPGLPLELLGPLGWGIQTGAGSVLIALGVTAGSSIAVFGTGGLVLDPFALASGRNVMGILEGDAVPALFIPRLIDLWQQGRFPFDKLITSYPLSQIGQAEADAASGAAVKPVLIPDPLA